MPTVTFPPGTNSSFLSVYQAIDNISFNADVVSGNSTSIVLASGSTRYEVSGTGFTSAIVGTDVVITGGTVQGVRVLQSGVLRMEVTALNLPITALNAAIAAEESGSDIAALENLFTGLNWTYFGNANADIFLEGTVSQQGIPLNLRGNDTFRLGGGNDHVFSGDGNDKLFGDAGNDTLRGGNGKDKLNGGDGDDVLVGGAGKDVLTGGKGADHFVFAAGDSAANKQRDIITDMGRGKDKIDLSDVLGALDGSFVGGGRFTGTAGQVRYADSILSVDLDGDRKADFSIFIENGAAIGSGDLLF